MSQTFSDSKQIGTVSTFAALTNTHFEGEKNALCWQRQLDGDFKEIVNQLTLKENNRNSSRRFIGASTIRKGE